MLPLNFNPQTQNTVYEIVSDLSGRQDHLEDRLTAIEDKLGGMAETLEGLPDLLSKSLGRQGSPLTGERNLLRPESAALALVTASNMPHSKSVPTASASSAGLAKTLLPPPLPPRTTNT